MIVHLFNSNVPHGPERLVLPALAAMKRDVAVGCLTERRLSGGCGTADYARSLGLPVFVVQVAKRWDRAAIAALRDRLDRLSPTLVHAHDVKASAYLWWAGGTYARVSTHHGVLGRPGWRAKAYERFYSRVILPRFDRALCVTDADRRLLSGRGIRNLVVHRNGVDAEPAGSRESIRRAWGIPTDPATRLVGAVARLSREKRHDRMLDAMARLPKGRDWRFVVFGDGAERAALERHAARLGVRTHWMGYRPTIGREMAGLDVLFALSENEGLPVSILEAGWSKRPVVASRVGGIPELITRSEEGFLVEPTDIAGAARALELILSDDRRATTMGAGLHARVTSEFTAAHWIKRLEEIYSPWIH